MTRLDEEGTMEIICPSCNAVHEIADKKVPSVKATANCKKCGGTLVVEPPATTRTELAGQDIVSIPQTASADRAITQKAPAAHEIVSEYPDLKNLPPDRFLLGEILSPTKKGSYKTRKNKFKVKVLMAVSGKLEEILADDEKVVRIGKGVAHYPVEILFGNGLLTMLYNHYAVVCTNLRIILININSRINRPTHYLFQVFYEEIRKIKRGTLFGTLAIFRKKGKRRTFVYVKRYVSKELKQFMAEKLHGKEILGEARKYLENLCPACFSPQEKGLIQCASCEAQFKDPKKALLRSLLLPGLGDIYLGHRFLGAVEMIVSLLLWLIVISTLVSWGAEFVVAFVLLFIYNGIDGLLTFHMARKGYMLA